MALMDIRQMSLINDPPPGRLPIRTFVRPYGDEVVRGAAAWALGRWIAAGVLGARCRAALEARREVESDQGVRREIDQALSAQSAVSSTSAEASRPGPSMA